MSHLDHASAPAADAHAGDHDGHDPFLAHHFGSHVQQFHAGKLGMWIFLVTEILLFAGLFCAYAVYRSNHPEVFEYAHRYLDRTLGAVNTVVLLFSSLTMAWAVRCAQLGERGKSVLMLVLTLLCACGFLGIKTVEYRHKWHEGHLWASKYKAEEPAANKHAAAAHDDGLADLSPIEQMRAKKFAGTFFSIYFVMTGLHGVHVLGGMAAIGWILRRTLLGHFTPTYFGPVDFVGLYWHLVDLIWIYLFPLLYLIH